MKISTDQIKLEDGFEVDHEGKAIRVHLDDNSDSPREWDNLGTMVCFHTKYDLGDKHNYSPDDFNDYEDLENAIRANENVLAILPVYMYDHSGITIKTTPFGNNWDSGQIGWTFITEDRLKELGTETRDQSELEDILREELKIYDLFLQGEVYGFEVFEEKVCECCMHVEEKEIDSAWGFYDLEGMVIAINDNFTD